MKTILLTTALFFSFGAFSQSKIYTITEQYSANAVTLDKIVVTNPDGVTTTYDITHFMKDVVAHDSEFNKILNEVISKGYELLNPSPNAHGDIKGMSSVFTRTWFLKQTS
jgi:bisphosphoglycerate-independent phosphoglycerate mutase (AlkP superfamily)